MPNARSRNKWRCALPRRMSLDITRVRSLTDSCRLNFYAPGFVTNSVKKLYIFCTSTTMTAPFDSSKAWMERVSINLLCTIAANILWLTRSLEGLNSLERDKRWSFRLFFRVRSLLWIDIIFWEYFVAHDSDFIKIKFRKLGDNYTIFHLIFWISWLFQYWFTRSGKCFG